MSTQAHGTVRVTGITTPEKRKDFNRECFEGDRKAKDVIGSFVDSVATHGLRAVQQKLASLDTAAAKKEVRGGK